MARWRISKEWWVLLAGVTLLFDWQKLDFWIESYFYDASNARFPLKSNWFFANLMHDDLKRVLIACGVIVLLITLYRALYLGVRDKRWLFLSTSLLLVPSIIAALKSRSLQMCPWDLSPFGGEFTYHALFDAGGVAGHGCSPAGHASAGYALLAFYFFWRETSPLKARYALIAGLALGSAMGLSQMVRGAHFLSHNLSTLWWSWFFLLMLDAAFRWKSSGLAFATAER